VPSEEAGRASGSRGASDSERRRSSVSVQ
jgi:hypothetical protein